MFLQILKRDLRLAFGSRGAMAHLLAYFLVLVTLFPLSAGADKVVLSSIGASVIWVAAILVSTISLAAIFDEDFEDGSLEYLLLMPSGGSKVILAKALAHWLYSGVPIAVFSPFLAYMLGMDADNSLRLLCSLLMGTPLLTLIGSLGASLTLGLRRSGVIASLLVMPLYIPVIIFSIGILDEKQWVTAGIGLFCLFLIIFPVSFLASCHMLKVAAEE